MANEWMILGHATLGSFAAFSSVWLYVELLHAKNENVTRVKFLSIAVTVFVWISYLIGGLFYVNDYSTLDKYIIKGSSDLGFAGSTWTFAHAFFTETKEHFFLIGVFLVLFLVLLAYRTNFVNDPKANRLMRSIVGTLVIGGIVMEGWGAIMAMGVRLGMIPL
ncbi:MAG: hypothetical protein ACW97Z_05465 [Candidatus Hodarchaeales archaeon]